MQTKRTVQVHHMTNNPTAAWSHLCRQEKQKVIKINVKLPSKPVEHNKVRFVCVSDTHSLTHNLKFDIPSGDILIHAGDFTKCGQKDEVINFDNWLGE